MTEEVHVKSTIQLLKLFILEEIEELECMPGRFSFVSELVRVRTRA